MNQVTNTLVLAILFVTIGFIAGAMIALWYSERDKKNAARTDLPAAAVDDSDHETARFLSDPKTGQLIIFLRGQRFEAAGQLQESERKVLDDLLNQAYSWVGSRPPTIPPVVPQTAPLTDSLPVLPISPASNLQPVLITAPPASSLASAMQVSPFQVDDQPKPVEKPKTMVEQINDILQEILEGNGMKNRSIKIIEDSRHGVVVWVGLDHYDGMDQVPDVGVRDLVRQAVREWERRTEIRK